MKGKEIGYIRVSSIDQTTDRQLDDIELDMVFEEKISAKTTNRPKLQECLNYLRDGDTLHVHSIDRLARNLLDLENIVIDLTARQVRVHFHKENLIFDGGEMSPVHKLMFQMLGAFAEFERKLIKERQKEGIIKAKERGVYKGRKEKFSDAIKNEIIEKYKNGMKVAALAKEYSTSRPLIYRIVNS